MIARALSLLLALSLLVTASLPSGLTLWVCGMDGTARWSCCCAAAQPMPDTGAKVAAPDCCHLIKVPAPSDAAALRLTSSDQSGQLALPAMTPTGESIPPMLAVRDRLANDRTRPRDPGSQPLFARYCSYLN